MRGINVQSFKTFLQIIERMNLMKEKSFFIVAGVSGVAAAILIALIRFVDVSSIGPEGTSIGMSHLNQFVFRLFGENMFLYHVTEFLGIAAILTAFVFALIGVIQLIKRRSILKVDHEILALGVLYMFVVGLYVLFEIVSLNFRPVIMPGNIHLEASFPSSHTMLVCVIMGSTIMLMEKYVHGEMICMILRTICAIMIGVMVIGRLISGVHWFTDIIGGILISICLLSLFAGVIDADSNTIPVKTNQKTPARAIPQVSSKA